MITASSVSLGTWIFALISSASVGLASLIPWLFNMTFFEKTVTEKSNNNQLKLLLSFAVGSILGDIFLHLIPESINIHMKDGQKTSADAYQTVGLAVISGVILFVAVDKIIESSVCSSPATKIKSSQGVLPESREQNIRECKTIKETIKLTTHVSYDKVAITNLSTQSTELRKRKVFEKNNNNNNNNNNNESQDLNNNNNNNEFYESNYNLNLRRKNNELKKSNDDSNGYSSTIQATINNQQSIDSAGYLNLIANGFDNFTHGLAIGASFLAGPKVGLLTTLVVLAHEIPHEICDYAILVRSGFTRFDAAKAQSMTAIFGVLGTATALCTRSIETLHSITFWLLPFSAGGFLHIALANVMTEIISQDITSILKFSDFIKQTVCMISGVVIVGML